MSQFKQNRRDHNQSGNDKPSRNRRRPIDSGAKPQAAAENREAYLEGRNPIAEALAAGRAINKIWVRKRQPDQRCDQRLTDLIEACRANGAIVMEVERSVLDQMAQTRQHQGVIAQVAARGYVDPFAQIEQIRAQGREPFLLLLDDLQDGYNFGSILRIADAAGVDLIVIPERRSVSLDAHVAKASAGAIEHVPVARVVNLGQFVGRLKQDQFWIFGTALANAQNYREVDYRGAIALVIGNEGRGMSEGIRKQCDFLVNIPMRGRINSLNAAVAAGIIVFEAIAQRTDAGKNG